MKAISCPQCGSLIRNILPHQRFSECDYCGAKVIIDERNAPFEPYDEDTERFRPLPNYVRPKTPTQPIFFAIALIGAFSFVLFVAALIPTKSTPVAPPIETESYKPIIFPQHTPTVEKTNDDDAAIIFDENGNGKVIVPKRVKRRLRQ